MSDETCWTVIRAAAGGDAGAKSVFARRYEGAVRAYFGARWRGRPLNQELDDAVQDVFVECFKDGGTLDKGDSGRGGFRPFLYAIARNVARRTEERRARHAERQASGVDPERMEAQHAALSTVFDRAWARGVMREAAELQRERAARDGEGALRRVELLRLRFHDGLPIRDIARRWNEDPARLHHEYAKARTEFRRALTDVVAFHHPGDSQAVETETAALIGLLA